MSIIICANSGKFSTDRTISEYNREIWKLTKSTTVNANNRYNRFRSLSAAWLSVNLNRMQFNSLTCDSLAHFLINFPGYPLKAGQYKVKVKRTPPPLKKGD